MSIRILRPRLASPRPKDASPDRAAAVQELLGGPAGAVFVLMNQACVSARK